MNAYIDPASHGETETSALFIDNPPKVTHHTMADPGKRFLVALVRFVPFFES
jgi:hypothetical protein